MDGSYIKLSRGLLDWEWYSDINTTRAFIHMLLCSHVKRRGSAILGGKQSNAYKDSKIRSAVYTDIYNQIKREFGLYDENGRYKSYKALKRRYLYEAHELIDTYELPKYLQERVNDCNAQMSMEVA